MLFARKRSKDPSPLEKVGAGGIHTVARGRRKADACVSRPKYYFWKYPVWEECAYQPPGMGNIRNGSWPTKL